MAFDMTGLTAIITGGASGIGAATAAQFAQLGANVAVFDINTDGVEHFAQQVDITDDASVQSGVQAVAEKFGGIDIVVNNAGIGAQGTVEANDDASWTSMSWASCA